MSDPLHSASMVAGLRALHGQGPEPVLIDPWAERLAGPGGMSAAAEAMGLKPSIARNVCLRHRYFDEVLQRLLAEYGRLQVVILGAGLDSRCLRLPAGRGGDLVIIEVDRPEASRAKQDRVKDFREGRSHPVTFLGLDLGLEEGWPDLAKALQNLPTLVLVEGVFCYLTPGDVASTLERVGGLPVDNLWLGFDTFTPDHPAQGAFEKDLHKLVGQSGEVLRGFFTGEQVRAMADQAEWQVVEETSIDQWSLRLSGRPQPAPHFFLWLMKSDRP